MGSQELNMTEQLSTYIGFFNDVETMTLYPIIFSLNIFRNLLVVKQISGVASTYSLGSGGNEKVILIFIGKEHIC